MLINLWYVAEWSETVKDKPVKAKVLGQDLVLFRGEGGKIVCLSNVCLHRGGSLAGGWCKNGHVVCPYHGWEFDDKGKVAHIPSEGEDARISDRFKVDKYPAEEHYGMIWVFMGDLDEKDRYPIPPFPEYDDPNWRMVKTEYTWQAEAARVVENGIDIAHASYVHPTFGADSTASDNYIEKVEKGEYWGTSTNVLFPPKLKGSFGLRRFIRKEKQETRVHPTWYLPGYVIRLQIDLRENMHLLMFDANTPVDENTTRTFAIQGRDFFKWPMFDKGSLKRLEGILLEDATIVHASQPHYLPETLQNELSVASDKFMTSFRTARRKHIDDMGWQIDTDKVNANRKKTVYMIPSPARKASEEAGVKWVFEKTPLVPIKKTLEEKKRVKVD